MGKGTRINVDWTIYAKTRKETNNFLNVPPSSLCTRSKRETVLKCPRHGSDAVACLDLYGYVSTIAEVLIQSTLHTEFIAHLRLYSRIAK